MSIKSVIVKWKDPKFPDEELDYELDWRPRLEGGETIIADPEVTSADGITVDLHTFENGISTFWLSGGDPYREYAKINLKAVTSLGKTIGAQCRLVIAER